MYIRGWGEGGVSVGSWKEDHLKASFFRFRGIISFGDFGMQIEKSLRFNLGIVGIGM